MEKKPTFFWQGLLILLPMLFLVAVGVYSLRQDKALAEAEAKQRAQTYADDVERQLAGVIAGLEVSALSGTTDNTNAPTFLVSTNGDLLLPPRIAPLSPSGLNATTLTSAQSQLWDAARTAEFSTNQHAAIVAYEDFLKTSPPVDYAARASYSLAVLLGSGEEATDLLAHVASATNSASDAGLPLPLLARMKRVEFAFSQSGTPTKKDYADLQQLCAEVIDRPTILTEPILEFAGRLAPHSAEVQNARRRVARDQLKRELYDAADKRLLVVGPKMFWVTNTAGIPSTDDSDIYLAMVQRQASQTRVACYPIATVRKWVDNILTPLAFAPEYFGFKVEIGGREISRLNARPWREKSHFSPRSPGNVTEKEYTIDGNESVAPIIATSIGSGDGETLKVHVLLTNRAALFKHQQARGNLFVGLIVVSAVVAGSGLWRSWRTFVRQQQLNEMKSNFVSSVSHELRAPIASVRLLAEALDRGAVSEQPKQREYFRFIVQECRRLTGLIENVLDFSRIEQGRKQYHFEETNLNALVEQTVKLMQPSANERGVKLESSIADRERATFNLVCDGLAVQQALVNLIDNAVKHSASGECVAISLDSIASSIRLSVTDHGPGIPPEDHQKIFERFYRRGSELRRETQGIGIGLTIVKHVAEAHGGCVLVDSAVGKGSRFTIELRVKMSNDERRTDDAQT